MKNKLNKTFSLLIVSLLAFYQSSFAQQGGLDLTFGTNNTGIYQDPLPLLTDTTNVARSYGVNEVLADGKIIVAGSALTDSGGSNFVGDFVVRRLNADGSPDNTFGTNGSTQTTFYRYGPGIGQQSQSGTYAMKVQPADGKIIVASQCINMNAPAGANNALGSDLCIVRYNANGTIDTSFGGNTLIAYGGNPNFPATTYTMDPGKVFTFTGTQVINPAITQGSNGAPVKIQVAPDGRIFVFGNSSDSIAPGGRQKGFVAVYSSSGALQNLTSLADTTGNTTDGWGTIQIYDGDLLSNGDFVAVGSHRTLVSSNPAVFSATRWKIFSGSSGGGFLDANVNTGGIARGLTMVRGNKILVGGSFGSSPGLTPAMVRYNGNLTLDTTFGVNGRQIYDGTTNLAVDTFSINSLKNQPDGKIIGTTNNGNIARFNPDGSLDRSFARIREDVADSLSLRGVLANLRYNTPFPVRPTSGTTIIFGGVSFGSNGKLVTSGYAGNGSVYTHAIVTQLKTSFRNGGTFGDFNNDGKSEIAVFRPTDGVWHQLDSFSGGYSASHWGLGTDKLAPADYDGDGTTDQAVFRNGIWYILQSSNGQVRVENFGTTGDLPVPGDFNGDGQADIAVFRPSDGNWYINYSNPIQPGNITFTAIHFGQSGDVPILGDFDGDGKSDITVFRNGIWYQLLSATNLSFRSVQFGIGGDIPVVGDYDGDGKADISVFRNGIWYSLLSQDGSARITQWGNSSDRPVPADYDNDGKTDLGVYRSGVWWILRSGDGGYSATSFGLPTDIPIPAAYLP